MTAQTAHGGYPYRNEIVISPTALFATLALFILHITPKIGTLGALGFLIVGCFLILRQPWRSRDEIVDMWWLLALPGWTVLSVLWSDAPALSLRYGILLTFTFMVAILIARRLSPLNYYKAVFYSFAAVNIISAVLGRERADGLGFLGIFHSKNAMASTASMLLISAAPLFFDRSLPRWLRYSGVAMTLLAALLLVKAQSVGAILASVGALAAAVGIVLLSRTSAWKRFFLLVMMSMLLLLAILLIMANFSHVESWFFHSTGKDVTLTGRTDLWAIAIRQIAERPVLGTGFQAFWIPGQPVAEEIWAQFGIASKSGFHFHNTLLTNAVELGLPFALLQTGIVFWAGYVVIVWAIRDVRAETIFFAAFMIRQFVLSLVEVTYFFQFDPITVITVGAMVYAIRLRRGE